MASSINMDNFQSKFVLIVDDETIIRMVACEALQEAGFEVLEANTADEALGILKARNDVAILFTDINMPGSLDGLELAELVKERWPLISLIITSGRSLQRALPGDGRFLPKPYSPTNIAEIIREMSDKDDSVKSEIPKDEFSAE